MLRGKSSAASRFESTTSSFYLVAEEGVSFAGSDTLGQGAGSDSMLSMVVIKLALFASDFSES